MAELFVWHLGDNSSQVALSEIFQLVKGDDISTLRYCVMRQPTNGASSQRAEPIVVHVCNRTKTIFWLL